MNGRSVQIKNYQKFFTHNIHQVVWQFGLISERIPVNKLEHIQKSCLKIIISEMYIGYQSALEMTGLSSLKSRRLHRCLDCSLKSIKHPKNKKMFPASDNNPLYKMREREAFKVNFARTTAYKNSTIPYCQRLLNQYFLQKKWKAGKSLIKSHFILLWMIIYPHRCITVIV